MRADPRCEAPQRRAEAQLAVALKNIAFPIHNYYQKLRYEDFFYLKTFFFAIDILINAKNRIFFEFIFSKKLCAFKIG